MLKAGMILGGFVILGGAALAASEPPAKPAGAGEIVVPYEPTPDVVVQTMLRIADVGPQDVVIDLGSGDGRIPITAAKDFGARGMGVELNPELVTRSRANALAAGVAERATFQEGDIFKADLGPATVVTMFLYRRVNLQLRPALLDLKPGTRIVSHFHDMEDWLPDRSELVKSSAHYGESWVRMWVVPAKAAGQWRWQERRAGEVQEHRLVLRQNFQDIAGELETESLRPIDIRDAKLSGAEIAFWVPIREGARTVRWDYRGHVEGDGIVGRAESGDAAERRTVEWSATRLSR
ncbi:MAG TPA: methyltransferase domain-containing protein [Alphaproteobacteria bacterium]